MVRKAFCISNTFIHVTNSPLIFDQKYDEHVNNINGLKSHNVIIFDDKDTVRISDFN